MKRGELLGNMIVLATNAHAGQFDKAGKPYILHPIRVLSRVKSDDEIVQAAAILHDVIEDTPTTYQDIRNLGGTDELIEVVKAVTKVPGETQEEYEERVMSNRKAMIVKMADLEDNSDISRLKGVTEKDIKRTIKYHMLYLKLKENLENG